CWAWSPPGGGRKAAGTFSLRSRQVVVPQRQRADTLARRGENRIAECGCDHGDRRLAAAAKGAATRYQHRLNLRHLSHAEHLIVVEIRLLDAAFFDRDLTIERSAESIDHRALDLHLDAHRVDNGTRIDRQHDAMHARPA